MNMTDVLIKFIQDYVKKHLPRELRRPLQRRP